MSAEQRPFVPMSERLGWAEPPTPQFREWDRQTFMLVIEVLERCYEDPSRYNYPYSDRKQLWDLMWFALHGLPSREAPADGNNGEQLQRMVNHDYKHIDSSTRTKADWLLDIIDFLLRTDRGNRWRGRYDTAVDQLNLVFALRCVAWRCEAASSTLVPTTDEHQLGQLAEAQRSPVTLAASCMNEALRHYTQRPQPQYRKAGSCAADAVEAIARNVVGDQKLNLGDCIKRLGSNHELEGHHCSMLNALWGWASNRFRHAPKEGEPDVAAEEAWLAIIQCSAWVNYLSARYHPKP